MKNFINRATGIKRLSDRVRYHRQRIEEDIRKKISQQAGLQFHCLDMMEKAKTGPYGLIGLVTPMPPAETGISFFSARLAKENAGKIDVFTEYSSIGDYYDQRAVSSGVSIFPCDLLALVQENAKYSLIVFSFGNSDHNLFVLRRLHSFAKLGLPVRIAVEIHDPFAMNICWKFLSEKGEFNAAFRKAYGSRLNDIDLSNHVDCLKNGICGVKALLTGLNVDEIVVHSNSARRMMIDDFGDDRPPVIKQGFHPVFRSDRRLVGHPLFEGPSIGSFGIPGTDKHLEETLGAFLRLKKAGLVKTAVFAGYNAYANIYRAVGSIPDGITVFSNPTDKELLQIMASVSVAVQLRRKSLGESSGVVPQLLGFGKTVICNQVGAFLEYGPAVRYVSGHVSVDSVYECAVKSLQEEASQYSAIESYVDRHNSERFFDVLISVPKDVSSGQDQ